MKELKGVLLELPKISAQIQFFQGLSGEIGMKTINIGAESYNGEYIVRPSFEEQKLETENRVMLRDVEIEPIPMEHVSNTAGGMTLIIGG